MATYYLSSVNGDDATADGTKTLPYATFGAIPIANGDLVLVDSQHSSGENIVAPGADTGAPIRLVSIDWSTGTGTSDESYLKGASFSKSGGIVFRGAIRFYGFTLKQNSASYWFEFGKDVHTDIEVIDCTLIPGNNTQLFLSGPSGTTWYTNRIKLRNSIISLSSGTRIISRWSAVSEIINCSISTDPGTDGLIQPYEGSLLIDGLDISGLTTGALLLLDGNGKCTVRNTPLPAGVSLLSTASPGGAYLAGSEVLYAAPDGSYDHITAEGHVSSTTAVLRSGGASMSYAMASTARPQPGACSLCVPIDRKVLDLSAARTLRVYIAQDGGTALTDQDFWVEVRYRKPSTGQGVSVDTRLAAPHLPGTALPSDTASTWTGLTSPTAQYVDVVVPADVAGDAHAEVVVHLAKPSVTVYVDPAVEVI